MLLVLVAYTNICFDRALVRSTTVKRARMLCRRGAMCRRVLSNDLSFLAGIGRRQIFALRTELRSNCLNGSGTNKIVHSRPAIPCSIKRSKVMSRPAIVATILPVTRGGRQPVFAEEAESESRRVCGLSTGADVLSAGRPILFGSANAFLNERDSRIDGHARTPQTLPRHHRRSVAKDARSTAYVVITRACIPWS
jgi:hypothetical protein